VGGWRVSGWSVSGWINEMTCLSTRQVTFDDTESLFPDHVLGVGPHSALPLNKAAVCLVVPIFGHR